VNNVSVGPEVLPMSAHTEKLRGSRSHLDDESSAYDKPPYSVTPQWVLPPRSYCETVLLLPVYFNLTTCIL